MDQFLGCRSDDGTMVSLVSNTQWDVTNAVELNGQVYALARDVPPGYYGQWSAGDVYLLTTAPEPATLSLLALGGAALVARRRKG